MFNLQDFLTENISRLRSGVEQRVYSIDTTEDVTTLIPQFVCALTEYLVTCWLSPGYGGRGEVWDKWNAKSQPEHSAMFDDLRNAFCNKNGEVLDHPDPQSGRTQAKGNFAETLLRWIEETFREGEKQFIPAAPLPASQGLVDLIEVIFHGGNWFAILWESKATEDDISGVVSDAYRQLDDYPNRMFYILQDRAQSLRETGVSSSRYASVLRAMPMFTKRRSHQIHYGLFVTHDAVARQPYLRDLPKHPSGVPDSCHHLTFVALPNFADLRDAVWREMELK